MIYRFRDGISSDPAMTNFGDSSADVNLGLPVGHQRAMHSIFAARAILRADNFRNVGSTNFLVVEDQL